MRRARFNFFSLAETKERGTQKKNTQKPITEAKGETKIIEWQIVAISDYRYPLEKYRKIGSRQWRRFKAHSTSALRLPHFIAEK